MSETDTNTVKSQEDKLKERIPMEITTIENEETYNNMINELLEDSKNIALSNIYPYEDWSEMELPKKYLNWQIRAAIELYNLGDKTGIKSYSENGLSFSRQTDMLSAGLMEEITSKVGVPKASDKNV